MVMNNLSTYVRQNFEGMLVFGDVHADFESFTSARKYATDNNLFFMSLGDLVDRGSKPFEVVESMARYMEEETAGFTIGNHDDKFYRYAAGNKVSLSKDAKNTLDFVGEDRKEEFFRLYRQIIDKQVLSGIFHKFDDFTIVHAASHPCMWEDTDRFGKSARSRALVGETTGRLDEDGYPERLYNWIEEVPMGKTVIVGHDRMPIHKIPINVPMICTNANGGKVIFMDTGCGKGGFLTAMVMVYNNGFKFDSYVEFK